MARKNIFMLVYIVILLIVFCSITEVYLRKNVFDPTQSYVLMPGWEINFRPHPIGSPGVYDDAHVKINSLGLRGGIPGNEKLSVLAVGGSTTMDALLSDEETWTGRLQSQLESCGLSVWVGNMGKAGTNARHHVLQIEQTLPRLEKTDLVLVLVGLNDMLFDQRIHHPKSLPENWDMRQSFMYSPDTVASWWQLTAIGYQISLLFERFFRDDNEQELVSTANIGAQNLKYINRRAKVLPSDWINKSPDLSISLGHYKKSLIKIIESVRKNGAEPILITQPAIWNSFMAPADEKILYAGGVGGTDEWFKKPNTQWYTSTALSNMLNAYNETLRDVCRKNGLRCVDLASRLEKSSVNFYDDFHFSERGAENVSSIIADTLWPTCRIK